MNFKGIGIFFAFLTNLKIYAFKLTSRPMNKQGGISCNEIKTVVFSGGGLRGGPMLAGAMLRLHEKFKNFDFYSPNRTLEEVRGTSIGSMAAIYVACRIPPKEFVEDMLTVDYEQMVQWSVLSLMGTYGLNDGTQIKEYFNNFIYEKTGIIDCTFEQLCAWSGLRIKIVASDINQNGEEFVMSGETTPKIKVSEAVAASMAIPIIFSPQRLGEKVLVDGGVVNHFPIAGKAGKCDPNTTLGFLCCPKDRIKHIGSDEPWSYYDRLISVLLRMLDKSQRDHREHIVTLKLESPESVPGTPVLTWQFTSNQRTDLVEKGGTEVDRFIKDGLITNLPSKSVSTQTQT